MQAAACSRTLRLAAPRQPLPSSPLAVGGGSVPGHGDERSPPPPARWYRHRGKQACAFRLDVVGNGIRRVRLVRQPPSVHLRRNRYEVRTRKALQVVATESGILFDFGRSSVGDGTYRFKRRFGAVPTPVLWLSDKQADLYARYAMAQRLWRRCPDFVTDRLGPRLCRYLADY